MNPFFRKVIACKKNIADFDGGKIFRFNDRKQYLILFGKIDFREWWTTEVFIWQHWLHAYRTSHLIIGAISIWYSVAHCMGREPRSESWRPIDQNASCARLWELSVFSSRWFTDVWCGFGLSCIHYLSQIMKLQMTFCIFPDVCVFAQFLNNLSNQCSAVIDIKDQIKFEMGTHATPVTVHRAVLLPGPRPFIRSPQYRRGTVV